MTFKETKMASIVLDDEETKETPSEDAPSTEGDSEEKKDESN